MISNLFSIIRSVYEKHFGIPDIICPMLTEPVSDVWVCCIGHSPKLYTYLLHFLSDKMSDALDKNVGHRGKNVGHVQMSDNFSFSLSSHQI